MMEEWETGGVKKEEGDCKTNEEKEEKTGSEASNEKERRWRIMKCGKS